MKRIWIAVLLVGLTGAGPAPKAPSPSSPEEAPDASKNRKPAAEFNVQPLGGGPALSLSSLRGKVVLVDFWATWCPPCREEIPHFKELYQQYKGRGLEIVGLSLDDGPGVVSQFVKRLEVTYPVAMATQALAQAYGGIRGIPTTFSIDKWGRISKKYVGYQDKRVFEAEIQALLAE